MEDSISVYGYWVGLCTLLHVAAFVGVCLHALQRRRNASATILWIFVAWSFPLIGPLLYLSFGIDRVPGKGLRKQATNQLLTERRRTHNENQTSFVAWHYEFSSNYAQIENIYCRSLNQSLNSLNTENPLLDGNSITPLSGGNEAYPLMIEAIRAARNHIHLQSFIIANDRTGRQFLDELRKKAEQGVTVRLLFDRFGSTHAYLGGMFRKYKKIPNLHICGWTQANPLKRQFQVNLRNHRKNLVVDGHLAFFGGR